MARSDFRLEDAPAYLCAPGGEDDVLRLPAYHLRQVRPSRTDDVLGLPALRTKMKMR